MNKLKLQKILGEIKKNTDKKISDSSDILEVKETNEEKILEDLKEKHVKLEILKKVIDSLAKEIEKVTNEVQKTEEDLNGSIAELQSDIETIFLTLTELEDTIGEIGEDTHIQDMIEEIKSEYSKLLEDLNTSVGEISENLGKNEEKLSNSVKSLENRVDKINKALSENELDTKDTKKDIKKLFRVIKKLGIDLDKYLKAQFEYGSQLQILSSSVFIGQSGQINFTGATVSSSAQGVITVAIPPGLTESIAAGTVNSVNRSFTFVSKPRYIISDHAWYKENKGWTWNSATLTATMDIPPNDDIYAF